MKKYLNLSLIIISFLLFVNVSSFAARGVTQKEYEFLTYSPEALDISFLYPKGWNIKKGDIEKGILFRAESPDSYIYNVYKVIPYPGEDLDHFSVSQGEWLSKNFDNYSEIRFERGKIFGEYKGDLRIYSYTHKNNRYEVAEFYFMGKDEYFYIVLFDTPQGKLEENLSLFGKLISGIKFLNTYTKEEEIFEKFVSPEGDFSIEYPKDWRLLPPKKDVAFFVTDGKGVYAYVLVHKISPSMSTKEYALSSEKWPKEHFKGYVEYKFEPYKKGNLNGFLRDYKYVTDNDTYYVVEYYFTHKFQDVAKGFILSFGMSDKLEYDYVKKVTKIKRKILDSFSITSQADK